MRKIFAAAASGAIPYVGNTQTASLQLQELTGGDVYKIESENTYPVSYAAASRIAKRESDANIRPSLTSSAADIASYDVIFVGFPLWWYHEPMTVCSFL